MCFDPFTIGGLTITAGQVAAAGAAAATSALTAAAGAVSSYAQVRAQNEAAVQQYKYQQQQQRLINKATQDQFNETLSRQRIEQTRAGQQNFTNAQQSILENQRRQAAAQANAASSGLTGIPLDMLFNEYQVSTGNIANNLTTVYQQLNENLFFNSDNAQREAQSRVNQAVPAKPYLAKFSIWPSLLQGTASSLGAGFNAFNSMGGFGSAGGGGVNPQPAAPQTQQSSLYYSGYNYA